MCVRKEGDMKRYVRTGGMFAVSGVARKWIVWISEAEEYRGGNCSSFAIMMDCWVWIGSCQKEESSSACAMLVVAFRARPRRWLAGWLVIDEMSWLTSNGMS